MTSHAEISLVIASMCKAVMTSYCDVTNICSPFPYNCCLLHPPLSHRRRVACASSVNRSGVMRFSSLVCAGSRYGTPLGKKNTRHVALMWSRPEAGTSTRPGDLENTPQDAEQHHTHTHTFLEPAIPSMRCSLTLPASVQVH